MCPEETADVDTALSEADHDTDEDHDGGPSQGRAVREHPGSEQAADEDHPPWDPSPIGHQRGFLQVVGDSGLR
ncbi:MAG: hypothetical protein R2698_02180 [Microthrixaceae bacterium]